MYHTYYLASLCQRRGWTEPKYQTYATRQGYRCVVRVNNREYQTSDAYSSVPSAKEGAALTAYSICRNFSANDGMYPAGFAHGGLLQGNPVAIGTDRHGRQRITNRESPTVQQHHYRDDSDSSRSSHSSRSSPDSFGQAQLVQPKVVQRHAQRTTGTMPHLPHNARRHYNNSRHY